MQRIKFPKTRRDKYIEHQKQLKEEREWWRKYMRQRDAISREARAAKLQRLFEAESQLPLATNEDSWSEAAFARPGLPRPWARMQQRESREGGSRLQSFGTDEGADEVFLEDATKGGPLPHDVADGESIDPEAGVPAVTPRSGRSSPGSYGDTGTERSYGISWVADDVDTVHTLSDHPQLTYDYSDTGVVDAASCKDVFCYLFGIGSYLWDVGSDLALAYKYYNLGHITWFALTLLFVAGPAVLMSIFSLVLYVRDHVVVGDKASVRRWIPRIVFLLLQVAPLWRVMETAIFACRSRCTPKHDKKAKLYRQMVLEDTDSMLLRLFEAFLEAAPQLTLQLYICTQIGMEDGVGLVIFQTVSLLTSWTTVAWVLVGFQRALRLSHCPERAPLTRLGMAFQFFWRLFTVAARVLALVMFASYFKAYVFIVVGAHWLLMLIWMCLQDTDYCTLESVPGKRHPSPFLELLFRMMTAFIHIFSFFNLIGGHTRLRAAAFYTLVYIENGFMVLAWYVSGATEHDQVWYRVPVFVMVFVGFFLGILFMFIYYTNCHPNNYSNNPRHQKIQLRVKWKQLSLFKDPNAVDPTPSETDHSSLMTQGLQNMPVGTSTPNGFPSLDYSNPPPNLAPLAAPSNDRIRTTVPPRAETSESRVLPDNNNVFQYPEVGGKAKAKPMPAASVPPAPMNSQPPRSQEAAAKPNNQNVQPLPVDLAAQNRAPHNVTSSTNKPKPLPGNSSTQQPEPPLAGSSENPLPPQAASSYNQTRTAPDQSKPPQGNKDYIPTQETPQRPVPLVQPPESSCSDQGRRPRRQRRRKPENFDMEDVSPATAFKVTSV